MFVRREARDTRVAPPGVGVVTPTELRTTAERLDALADGLEGKLSARRRIEDRPIAGTRLIREWKGVAHEVTVRNDHFEYQGRPYKSLTAIARSITGTQWNGHIFFGLRTQKRR